MPKIDFPEKNYLISRKYKIIYCPIAKNASSKIKSIFMRVEGIKKDKDYANHHAYLHQCSTGLSLKDYSEEEVEQFLHQEKYFKFAIIRNPFSRLASAYLNKFVVERKKRVLPDCREIIKAVYKKNGAEPDIEKSISFSQFIHYIASVENLNSLNPHWRPQHFFLGSNHFDKIFCLENLDYLFDVLESKFNRKLDRSRSKNKTEYSEAQKKEHTENRYDLYLPHEFETSGFISASEYLYTPELREIVKEKYAKDFEIYNQIKTDEALTDNLKVVSAEPEKDISDLEELAKSSEAKGNLLKAANYYLKLTELKPQKAQYKFRLANILNKQNKLQKAIQAYQQAIELQPKRVDFYLHLAKAFNQTGQVQKAIQTYHKVFELNPQQPLGVYQNLGNALSKQGRLDRAREAYQTAIKLGGNSSELYYQIGQIFQQKGNLEQTIVNYQKSIERNPQFSVLVYKDLGDALQKQEKWEQAAISYQKGLELKNLNVYRREELYYGLRNTYLNQGLEQKAQISHKKAYETHYFINHDHKLIYCNIHQNAPELFRRMMVDNSEEKELFKQLNLPIAKYLDKANTKVRLTDFSYLDNPDYFKFAILCNPFERLVRAYLDKFVKSRNIQNICRPVIGNVYKFLGMEPDFDKGITYKQFLQCLARTTNDISLNTHWRPQHTFLGLDLFRKFDFIGQFEQLDSVIEHLENKFGFKIKTSDVSKATHIRKYGEVKTYSKPFHDMYPEELRTLDTFPKAVQLYTPELEELVRVRYAQDIALYESEFNTTLNSYS